MIGRPRLALALATVALMTWAPLAESSATPEPTAAKSTFCGRFSSDSIYRFAKVYAIRGTTCPRALAVGRRYDNQGLQTAPWRCFLARQDLPRLFSCGWGGSRGDVRKFPHALVAIGSKG